jgi:hypothetical protein
MRVDEMGQWPCLLNLPEFAERYTTRKSDAFLASADFARSTGNELEKLGKKQNSPDFTRRGLVTGIENFSGNFRVTYDDPAGKTQALLAAKIDVCSGPGIPKKLEPTEVRSEGLSSEYHCGESTDGIRRLMTGEDFLKRGTMIPDGARVCVCGSGGTAAWCVERALKSNSTRTVTWVSRELSDASFPPSGRNDGLVNESLVRRNWQVEPQQQVSPSANRLGLAFGYEVESVALQATGKLQVDFRYYQGQTGRCHVDYLGQDCGELGSPIFDQVVIAVGQIMDIPEFLRELTESGMMWQAINRSSAPNVQRSGNSFVAGFANHTDQKRATIRILGPAACNLPDDRFPAGPLQKLTAYESTLARQCCKSVIPTAGLSIGWANGLFCDGYPNRNINTIDQSDLIKVGMNLAQAKALVTKRQKSQEPFTELPRDLQAWDLKCHY